jgi:hypothetical protein
MGHVVCASMSHVLDIKKGLGLLKGHVVSRLEQSKKVMNRTFDSLQGQEEMRSRFRAEGKLV